MAKSIKPKKQALIALAPNVTDNTIEVFPAKKFFVESLTRDIDLADAILDLLDNCVDGARRLGLENNNKPYQKYRADINFTGKEFSIKDNCGGIPLTDAKNCAFKFGRPSEYANRADGTIGVIGIGMKRAILKLGKSTVVHSRHSKDVFQVKIEPEWIENEDWNLKFDHVKAEIEKDGTLITVSKLNESVQAEFENILFSKKLWEKVTGAFALLISRGFSVYINGKKVESQPPSLLWQKNDKQGIPVIRPYIYRDEVEGVHVYIAVGFREADRQTNDNDSSRSYYSTEPAGWTVACNDRVVLFCDKSEQTGWGTGRVPEYHTQFIRISGFAEFSSKDSSKLPFTTTKHGINQQSKVFLKVFDRMREGTKLFTDWTNEFKDFSTQKIEAFENSNAVSLNVEEIKKLGPQPQKNKSGSTPESITFKPRLPKPRMERSEKTIAFKRPLSDVELVAEYLFGNVDESASRVGEKCFDLVLNKIKK